MALTQHRHGLFGRRYGSFAGRASAPVGAPKTQRRHALFGRRYGSFANKGVTVTVFDVPGVEYTLPDRRFHYTLPDRRFHYTLPERG